MINKYDITVLTNKNLGDPAFMRALLKAWNNVDLQLKPEFFGLGEPVRYRFAEKGIDYAIEASIKNGMGLMLRRQTKYKYLATIDWFSGDRGLDTRPFPWSCNILLRPEAGDNLASKLFKFLIKWFEPAFGYLSTNQQVSEKHFITFEDLVGTSETYLGLDIEEPAETLPGIYWATYFGPWAIDKIGAERFTGLKAQKLETLNSGYLVSAYDSSTEAGTPKARKAEEQIKRQLGKNHFFDKAKVDIEELMADEEEAEIIEEKIAELKAKKKAKK